MARHRYPLLAKSDDRTKTPSKENSARELWKEIKDYLGFISENKGFTYLKEKGEVVYNRHVPEGALTGEMLYEVAEIPYFTPDHLVRKIAATVENGVESKQRENQIQQKQELLHNLFLSHARGLLAHCDHGIEKPIAENELTALNYMMQGVDPDFDPKEPFRNMFTLMDQFNENDLAHYQNIYRPLQVKPVKPD